MADFGPYSGLDPSVVGALQAPPVQQVSMPEYPIGNVIGSIPPQPPPPPPPPPPPTQKIEQYGGLDPTLVNYLQGGHAPEVAAPSTEAPAVAPYSGLHPSVVSGVQNGFSLGAPAESTEAQAPSAAPVQNAPDYKLGTSNAPQTSKEIAASNKAYAQQQAKRAAFDASPEGIAQRAEAMAQGSIEEERQALKDSGAAQAAQNDATASAIQKGSDRETELDKVHAARQLAFQQDRDKYTAQYMQQAKDAADFKVDTDRHIGWGGLLAVALSGIGNALDHNHGPNAALQILENGIDKRIADQWAQKKALGEKASQTKEMIGLVRGNAEDDRHDQEMDRAALREKMANDIKLAAAQTANPLLKANMLEKSAQLSQKSAQIVAGEAQRKAQAIKEANEEADRKASIGIQAEHLALARRTQDFNEQQAALAQARELLVQQGKVTQDDADRGVWMPTGRVDEKTGVPESKPLTQQGGEVYHQPAGKAGETIAERHAATLKVISAIDKMRAKRAEFGGSDQLFNKFLSTEDGRLLQQDFANGIMALHQASGVNRFSGEVVDLSKEMLTGGVDPTSMKSVVKALELARVNATDNFNADLKGIGKYTGKPIEFHDSLHDPKPTQTVQDFSIKLAKESPLSNAAYRYSPIMQEFGEGSRKYLEGKLEEAGGMLPSQRNTLDTIAANSRDPDPNKAAQARAQLEGIAKDAEASSVRDLAKAYLSRIDIPETSLPTTGPTTSVARDTLSYGSKK